MLSVIRRRRKCNHRDWGQFHQMFRDPRPCIIYNPNNKPVHVPSRTTSRQNIEKVQKDIKWKLGDEDEEDERQTSIKEDVWRALLLFCSQKSSCCWQCRRNPLPTPRRCGCRCWFLKPFENGKINIKNMFTIKKLINFEILLCFVLLVPRLGCLLVGRSVCLTTWNEDGHVIKIFKWFSYYVLSSERKVFRIPTFNALAKSPKPMNEQKQRSIYS